MKIAIGYPPIEQDKGTPLLSQNRQFQYFNSPTYIYPMIPAFAATLAKQAGHEVLWMDGIAEKKTYKEWLAELRQAKPDLLMIETKTPVVRRHWKMIEEWKKKLPDMYVVMVGDHITHLPQESMDNAPVDFLITGGDYDFVLVDLLESLEHGKPMPSGVWGRDPKTKKVWN
ncbi:MAG: B12-binding domain-containing radical SAM protein, partial [Patescibacteria group bacterium]